MSDCEVWSQFLSDPDSTRYKNALLARRDELLEHLEDCPSCLERMPSERALQKVYEVLAHSSDPDDEEELASAASSFQLRLEVDEEIRSAMSDVLYHSLRPALVARVAMYDPLTVFQAIDGLSMFFRRYSSHAIRRREPAVLLLHREYLRIADGQAEPVSSQVLTREVMVTAGLDAEQSSVLLSWTIEAARELPRFFVAAATAPGAGKSVLVLVEKRPEHVDLAAYWAPANQHAPAALRRFVHGQTITDGGPNG